MKSAGVQIFLVKGKKGENLFQIAKEVRSFKDLFYSSKNRIAVEEEMLQINDLTKWFMSPHDEHNEQLGEEDRAESHKWLMNKSFLSREKYIGG